jgi:hypothetical protein
MADKQFIRESLSQLLREIDLLTDDKDDQQTWSRRRSVVYAEAEHVLRLALPEDSPLLVLFKSAIDPAAAPEQADAGKERARAKSQLESVKEILSAARRLNEARFEADATTGLAEDIHRILGRDLLRYPPVQLLLLLLAAAIGFAVFGVVRFQDMKVDVREQITQTQTEAVKEIDGARKQAMDAVRDLKAQVQQTSAEAEKLIDNIGKARQRVSDLTVSAIKDLTAQQVASVEAAATASVSRIDAAVGETLGKVEKATRLADITGAQERAVAAIDKAAGVKEVAEAQKSAIEKINAAVDRPALKEASDLAVRAIGSQAAQYYDELKVSLTPTFKEVIERNGKTLEGLSTRLEKADSHARLIDAAIDRMGLPDDAFIGRLAAYFNETILAVYVVLGWALLIFVFNLVLCFILLRRISRRPAPLA